MHRTGDCLGVIVGADGTVRMSTNDMTMSRDDKAIVPRMCVHKARAQRWMPYISRSASGSI